MKDFEADDIPGHEEYIDSVPDIEAEFYNLSFVDIQGNKFNVGNLLVDYELIALNITPVEKKNETNLY